MGVDEDGVMNMAQGKLNPDEEEADETDDLMRSEQTMGVHADVDAEHSANRDKECGCRISSITLPSKLLEL